MADRPPDARAEGKAASPGGLLRRRREKRALSVAEVAKRLHLDAGIIAALEKDDYARIASPVYVRGYLASYARLVEADSERIVALFDSIAPVEPPAIAPAVKPPMQVSSSHQGMRMLSYLIALGLVILFVIWYRGHFSAGTLPVEEVIMDEAPPAPAVSAAAPAALPAPAPAPAPVPDMASAAPVEAGAPRPQTQAEAPQPQAQAEAGADSMPPALTPAPFVAALAGEAVDEAEPAREAGQAAAETGQTGPPPDEIDEVAPPSPDEINEAAALENTEDDEAATIIAPAVSAAAPDSLRLIFSDDSWVEVYDANENRLFRDLALSGEEHLIEGVAPFRILFGFSPGVTAEFNGARVEHAAYARYGIARFTLPEAARP